MASKGIMTALELMALERDRQEFALGDTLDIKTGLILAALTFLAIQSDELIKSTGIPPSLWKEKLIAISMGQVALTAAGAAWIMQIISVLALIVGGIFSVRVLWPRDYNREAPPRKYLDWIVQNRAYREDYPETDTALVTAEDLTAKRVEFAIENVQTNLAINNVKSGQMAIAFYCAAASFFANVITLAIHLF